MFQKLGLLEIAHRLLFAWFYLPDIEKIVAAQTTMSSRKDGMVLLGVTLSSQVHKHITYTKK